MTKKNILKRRNVNNVNAQRNVKKKKVAVMMKKVQKMKNQKPIKKKKQLLTRKII